MYMFKGLLLQWYAQAIQVAPYAADKVLPTLKKSAQAAISQCTGGAHSRQCGLEWSSGKYDGTTGANQELSVLNAVFAPLISDSKAPVTAETGGTSKVGSGSTASGGSDKGGSDKDSSDKDGSSKDGSGKGGDKGSAGTAFGVPTLLSALATVSSAVIVALW